MTTFFTYGDIKTKVERDLDLEGETFITDEEMLGYANEAVDEVERQIHALYDDYFLTRSTIALVAGTEEYALPSDIYAMKIRAVVYRNGSQVWQVPRIRDWKKFLQYEMDQATGTTSPGSYGFFVLNQTAGSPKIVFAPTPQETGSFLKIWYIRNANTLTTTASTFDIPESINYVMQYMKVRCYEKEMNPNIQKAMVDLEREKTDTLAVLANMFPDNENDIEMDTRLYDDMT